jgi:hypothetical protein
LEIQVIRHMNRLLAKAPSIELLGRHRRLSHPKK